MANTYTKRCLTLIVLKLKTTMGYHFPLTRMAIVKKKKKREKQSKCWRKLEPLLAGLCLPRTMKLREISLCLLKPSY